MNRKIWLTMLFLLLVFAAAAASADVKIDSKSFPDEVFRKKVLDKIDQNQDGILSDGEAAAVKRLSFTGKNHTDRCSDFRGIELFPNLKSLTARKGGAVTIDLSGNPELETLEITETRLRFLDVSHNPRLKKLNVSTNRLPLLDVSGNPELEELGCGSNRLSHLDLSRNPRLQILLCSFNRKLQSLDLTRNTMLRELYCDNCAISELLLPDTVLMLSRVGTWGNRLTALDLRHMVLILKAMEDPAKLVNPGGEKVPMVWSGDIRYDVRAELGLNPHDYGFNMFRGENIFYTELRVDYDVRLITGAE